MAPIRTRYERDGRGSDIVLNHIGIIPDGARRWAKDQGIPLFDSYMVSMHRLAWIIDYLMAVGCRVVSVYMLSVDNLKRSAPELDAVFAAATAFCVDIIPSTVRKYSAEVQVVGKVDLLPTSFRSALTKVTVPLAGCSDRQINLLVAYSPWDEIRVACLASGSVEDIASHLDVPLAVDAIIRTGRVALLSGFLPMQSQYAVLYTLPKLFNEVTRKDVDEVLRDFACHQQLRGR